MTAHKLGRRVNNDIRAVLNGTHEPWRGKGIVHYQRDGVVMGKVCQSLHIHDIAVGVAHALHKDRTCAGGYGWLEKVCLARVHKGGFNSRVLECSGVSSL